MACAVVCLPAGSRIAGYVNLGVIGRLFPPEKGRDVLKHTNCASVRERDLPARGVVYSVIEADRQVRGTNIGTNNVRYKLPENR